MLNGTRRLILALAALSGIAHAAPPRAGYLTFENDRFFHSDRYYTNGLQYSLRIAENQPPRWTNRACRLFQCTAHPMVATQHDVGQLMYTPSDIANPAPQPLDRPWAGLLYYARSHTFRSPDRLSLTSLTWLAGVTGRASLAEQSQRLVHKLMDIPAPQGWDHQVGGSLGLMAAAERRWALQSLAADWGDTQLRTAAYWRIAAGNVMTYAGGGLMFTLGKDLPPVSSGPPAILNKVATLAEADTTCLVSWLRCTAFAGVEARAVAYNVFLDGRYRSDDPEVDSRPFVGDGMVGLRLDFPHTRTSAHGPWFLQVNVTRRTREFRSPRPVFLQTFGAITAGLDW